MPYRLNPKNKAEVQKNENGRWVLVKRHPTTDKARKHLAALEINVMGKER